MPWFPLAILELVLLILAPCRLCAARNDPGGRQAAGVHRPTWEVCLFVALAVAALLAALVVVVFACRRRNQNNALVAVAPAAQNRYKKQVDKPNQWWSSSMSSPRNPMSINPTMVRSAQTTPSPHWAMDTDEHEPEPLPPSGEQQSSCFSKIFAAVVSSRGRSSRPPAQAAASPVRPGGPRANRMEIHDPLACYSPASWVRVTHLDYDQLQSGTNEFKSKSLPGRHAGPWNVVLKDTEIVEDKGLPAKVTIKRHHATFTEEDCKRIREELKGMCTLRHRNLVKLHGYSLGNGRLYLVYDYMPNGILEDHLFPLNGAPVLDWLSRYRIAKEVAQGLDPLHVSNEPHGSISVSSIMLDHDYIARLDDHFYYRPEMRTSTMAERDASLEADIADLGAVFLELACGRRRTETCFSGNGTTMTLVDWVWALYGEAYKEPDDVSEGIIQRRVNQERLFGAVDRALNGEINKAQALKLLILGLACSHPDSKMRPKIRDVRMVLLDKNPVPQLPLSKPNCRK